MNASILSAIILIGLAQAPPVREDGATQQVTLQQAPPLRECGCSFGEICLCGPDCKCHAAKIAVSAVAADLSEYTATEKAKAGSFPMLRYLETCRQSLATGRPYAVFVGCTMRSGLGDAMLMTEVPAGWFPGYADTCVIVGAPVNGSLQWKATLQPAASDTEIRQALAPKMEARLLAQSFQPVQQFMQLSRGGFGGGGGSGRGGSC